MGNSGSPAEYEAFMQKVREAERVRFRDKNEPVSGAWEILRLQATADCEALSAGNLRKAYPREARIHAHMHERAVRLGRFVSAAWKKFRDFLRHMGPRVVQFSIP